VDDEEPVRKALCRLFGSAGFDVQTFASGSEFIESLKQKRPDCVVLDVNLDGLSGLEVQQRLGQENPKLPVIMMTGMESPGLREQALKAGAAAYLRKPLEERTLLEAVAAATLPDGTKQRRHPEASPKALDTKT